MRLGVLGGTFDPPHYGHLILAEQARDQLRLDSVWWVPAADQPLKRSIVVASVEHRLKMVSQAIAHNPFFALSRLDVDRPGPHYTVDMLALLRGQQPDAALFLLLGADSLRDLQVWRDPARLTEYAYLVAAHRPGVEFAPADLDQVVPDWREKLILLDAPSIDISAREIRRRVGEGRSIRYLLPEAVAHIIRQHQLYR
jgi:nicotinate-nucleotide adenylyltransferase